MSGQDHAARAGRSMALAAAMGLAAFGCRSAREGSPSSGGGFKARPLAIGELRVTNGDTAYVLMGRGYELSAPTRELLVHLRPVFDGAARRYGEYFGAEPTQVRIAVEAIAPIRPDRDRRSVPSAAPVAPRPVDEAGGLVRLRVPELVEDVGGEPALAVDGGLLVRPVVRAWVAASGHGPAAAAAVQAPAASPAPTPAAVPASTSAPGATQPVAPAALPDWFTEGASTLVAAPMSESAYLAVLAQTARQLPPLARLFASRRPRGEAPPQMEIDPYGSNVRREQQRPTSERPRRAGDPGGIEERTVQLDSAVVFSMQAYSVVRFLTERAGPPMVTTLAGALARGQTVEQALAPWTSLPHDVAALDRAWRDWLRGFGADAGRRR